MHTPKDIRGAVSSALDCARYGDQARADQAFGEVREHLYTPRLGYDGTVRAANRLLKAVTAADRSGIDPRDYSLAMQRKLVSEAVEA